MLHELNLARRPFVDTRPANAVAALLGVVVLLLSFWSVRTVSAYLEGSRRTREAVAALRGEIERLEAERQQAEAGLSRFDLVGLGEAASEANELARLRAFSWTRLLSRLEEALPAEVRIVSIGVERPDSSSPAARKGPVRDRFRVTLSLVSQDPDGLPDLIRALYASPYFDDPLPQSEQSGARASGGGADLAVTVTYLDVQVAP